MASERENAQGSIVDPEDSDPEMEAKLAEARAKKKEIELNSGMQKHLHNISVFGVYIVGLSIIGSIAVWILHFAIPSDYRFLTPEQVQELQKVLFSGFVGGAIGSQSKRFLK